MGLHHPWLAREMAMTRGMSRACGKARARYNFRCARCHQSIGRSVTCTEHVAVFVNHNKM